MSDCTKLIQIELYTAFKALTDDPELLSIIGSWGDTMPDDEILDMLRDYNAGKPTLHAIN